MEAATEPVIALSGFEVPTEREEEKLYYYTSTSQSRLQRQGRVEPRFLRMEHEVATQAHESTAVLANRPLTRRTKFPAKY